MGMVYNPATGMWQEDFGWGLDQQPDLGLPPVQGPEGGYAPGVVQGPEGSPDPNYIDPFLPKQVRDRMIAERDAKNAERDANYIDPFLPKNVRSRMTADRDAKRAKAEADAKAAAEARAARDAQTAQLNEKYGSEYSWAQNPEFLMNPVLLGQSQRALAQSDPMAQLAQYAGLGKANELMNTDFSFMGPEQQQQMLDLVKQMAIKAQDPKSFEFDRSGRQDEQYGNYQGIIAGGGADAIERAMRLRARQDSESWLRGQREADLQSYGERGLGGSGMELQSLSQAQQGAAGRNALADAEMAAALEKRKMDAIGGASDLASMMRQQAIDEQKLYAGSQDSILATGATIANAMRQAQLDEQLGARKAQNDTLSTYGDLASKIRDASFDEAHKRATGADDFEKINVDAKNAARDSNTAFYQKTYADLMERKFREWQEKVRTGTGAASTLLGTDERENNAASNQATGLAKDSALTWNDAAEQFRKELLGTMNDTSDNRIAADQNRNSQIPGAFEIGGRWAETLASMGMGAYGGEAMGGAGGGGMAGAMGGMGGMGGGSVGPNLGNWASQLNLGSLGGVGSSGSGSQNGYQLQMPKTGQGGFDYSDYLKRTGGQW